MTKSFGIVYVLKRFESEMRRLFLPSTLKSKWIVKGFSYSVKICK